MSGAPQTGGSLAALMAAGSDRVDEWVAYAKENNATTPELIAMMFINCQVQEMNQAMMSTVIAATAIQRLAGVTT